MFKNLLLYVTTLILKPVVLLICLTFDLFGFVPRLGLGLGLGPGSLKNETSNYNDGGGNFSDFLFL